jgi:prepilin-type N-terminal cleavage/methylation domain-containing protein/prepilin-type processing-associated H-X9-DG protein
MIVRNKTRRGFTLIELLVVIAIIGVMMGLLASAVMRVRMTALRMQCSNHLRQIGLALHNYHDSQLCFPPGNSFRNGQDPNPHMSWLARILPFVEQEALWRQTIQAYAQDSWFLDNPPHVGLSTVIPVYGCPADSRTQGLGNVSGLVVAFTAYLGVEGVNQSTHDGMLYLDSRVRLADVRDGTSNTLLVGERPPSSTLILGWWYAGWGQEKDGSLDMDMGVQEYRSDSPLNNYDSCPLKTYEFGPGQVTNPCDAYHFWSMHGGGANFLLVDGSVRFLSYGAAPLMPALATRAGGEVASVDG